MAFDFAVVKEALEGRDAEFLLSLYSDDATMTVINQNTPPSRPFRVTGSEFKDYVVDVLGRDLTHEVSNEVIDDGRISYTEACTYDDGTVVLAANYLEVSDGKITAHTSIETWDQ